MKLEEIKNMSDEEFVKLVISNMEDYKGKTSPNRGLDKFNHLLIGSIFSMFSYLCVGLNDEKLELGTLAVMLFTFLGGYEISRWATYDGSEKLKEELRRKIIVTKDKIEKMDEEEFNSLIENARVIKRNMVSDEVFDSAKVLSVANALIELDATSVLDEFEKINQNVVNDKYSDDSVVKTSSFIKNN